MRHMVRVTLAIPSFPLTCSVALNHDQPCFDRRHVSPNEFARPDVVVEFRGHIFAFHVKVVDGVSFGVIRVVMV